MANGNPRENMVAEKLRQEGYFVSSLRHEPGPGDILAIRPTQVSKGDWKAWNIKRPLLVEVKGTRDFPWTDYKGFGRPRRQEMLDAADRYWLEPILAWWPPSLRGGPIWIPAEDWPGA